MIEVELKLQSEIERFRKMEFIAWKNDQKSFYAKPRNGKPRVIALVPSLPDGALSDGVVAGRTRPVVGTGRKEPHFHGGHLTRIYPEDTVFSWMNEMSGRIFGCGVSG